MKTITFENPADLFMFLVENRFLTSAEQSIDGYNSPAVNYMFNNGFSASEGKITSGVIFRDKENDGHTYFPEISWSFNKKKPHLVTFYGTYPDEESGDFVSDLLELDIFTDEQRSEYEKNGEIAGKSIEYRKTGEDNEIITEGFSEEHKKILIEYLNKHFSGDYGATANMLCGYDEVVTVYTKIFDVSKSYYTDEDTYTCTYNDDSVKVEPDFDLSVILDRCYLN